MSSEQVNNSFRLVVIDGPEIVCTDSTGDLPLWQITIDLSKCSFEAITQTPIDVPITIQVPRDLPPPFVPLAPVPEASTLLLMAAGLALMAKKVWR